MLNTRKEQALWDASIRYFQNNKKHWNTFINILNKEVSGTPSLRLIFYYVSKYAKYNTVTKIQNSNPFQIHTKYRQMMRAHTKKCFDPFCRKKRVELTLHNKTIITNVAQLVFFRWLLCNNIYNDVLHNHSNIMQNMKKERKLKHKNNTDIICVNLTIPANVLAISGLAL